MPASRYFSSVFKKLVLTIEQSRIEAIRKKLLMKTQDPYFLLKIETEVSYDLDVGKEHAVQPLHPDESFLVDFLVLISLKSAQLSV